MRMKLWALATVLASGVMSVSALDPAQAHPTQYTHSWHKGPHHGVHTGHHWDRRHGWHGGRHYGWHQKRHHDWNWRHHSHRHYDRRHWHR